MTRIKGLDASHWNGKPDWFKAKQLGIEWAYVKVGEMNPSTGKGFTDDQYARNIAKLKEAGVISGAYYFFHPSVGASVQARQCLKLMELYGQPELPLVVDLETSDNQKPQDVASVLKVFMERIEEDTGRRPLIYTTSSFWGGRVGAPDWGKDYYFIIAQYPYSEPIRDMDAYPYKMSPVNTKIADRVVAWQFSDNVRLPGLPRFDGNFWLAGSDLLYELAGRNQPDVIETEEPIPAQHSPLYEHALEIWNKSHIEMNSVWWKLRNLGR